MSYSYYQPFGFFGPIFMIIFWIIIIMAVVSLVRWGTGHSGRGHGCHGGGNKALDILKERFAKGEIDEKEFEEKKKVLIE